ncbi:deoxynucleotidyltransferase terminal-interacting protein 2 [Ranitomeya variabilis]|uniref:deoxynucleotidyltransferase terminal-interacting protein 2 n=1 Tax=Ranitomeya variabilis TaxID=490064 RepID=UPI004056A873
MVATRRGTRVENEDAGIPEEQKLEDNLPTSPIRTRRSVRTDGQTGENSTDESISGKTSRSPLICETIKRSTQITTRSRRRSGQSDAEVSEAGSTASNASTTRSRSGQNLGQLTDSTRKLRSHRSALITEPIIESKENSDLSEGESNCSSVSTKARRRQPRTAPRTVSTRGCKSLLPSSPDVSDAESNSSSVSEVKMIATRSTRNSRARHPSQNEQSSDAESCSSGFSLRPLASRSSRRNKPKVQTGEIEAISENNEDDPPDQETLMKQSPKINAVISDAWSSVEDQNVFPSPRRRSQYQPTIHEDEFVSDANKDDTQDQRTLKKLSPKTHTVKSDAQSSVEDHNVLSSLRRSSRNQPAVLENKAAIEADYSEKQSRDAVNRVLDLDQPEMDETSKIEVDLCVETGPVSSVQSKETHPEEDILPDQVLRLSETSVDEEPAIEESHFMNESDVTEETNKTSLDLQESEDMAESMKIHLSIDSEESEKSERSDDDQDDDDDNEDGEHNMEEDIEEVVDLQKSKKSSQQLNDVVGDGLFVIDTAPGMDAGKKYYMEDDDKEEDEQGEVPGSEEEDDDDDEDFIDKEEEDDEDEEQTLLNRPKSGFVLSTSIDPGINIKEMGGLYINFDAEKPNPGPSLLSKMKKGHKTDELLQKSVITPDFEKKECVLPYKESRFKLKKMRKEEWDKTSGRGWFDMKAPELTDELKNDLKALKMRSAMDSKHFYKKNDRDGFPKYFEVGTVVDNPIDFYHSRIPKKNRKRTIVEELLADSEFRRNNKKKYKEIIAEKAARAEGKKFRKKKKFRT